jgi:hypothetical protein
MTRFVNSIREMLLFLASMIFLLFNLLGSQRSRLSSERVSNILVLKDNEFMDGKSMKHEWENNESVELRSCHGNQLYHPGPIV